MTLGRAPAEEDLYRSTRQQCEARLPERSIFRLLANKGHELFPDEAFADLYVANGRPSIPPRIISVVMVLQRYCGMSDREAVDAFAFDMRWKYAAGALDYDYPGFVHTVLVEMRERLRRSEDPNRIFNTTLDAARDLGLVGRKRVLDSTALYDAVATQDTVTLVRSALVKLLDAVDDEVAAQMRAAFVRDDEYRTTGKPKCDWDDKKAREELIDALAKDAFQALAIVHGQQLDAPEREAAELLATVVGQDIERSDNGVFRIVQGVAEDRVISVVDPEARHGHKTAARGFDGYKGHIAIDPDSEIITATAVTAGNVGDAVPAEQLLSDLLAKAPADVQPASEPPTIQGETTVTPTVGSITDAPAEPSLSDPLPQAPADVQPASEPPTKPTDSVENERSEVYGDASYGTADLVERLEAAGIEPNVKVQPPSAREGKYSQDDFRIDLDAGTVQCPAGQLVKLRIAKDGSGEAQFGASCKDCPLRGKCTESKAGRTVYVHPKHRVLDRARRRQRDPGWRARYRATRPKVERKFAHVMRHKHGGRRARVRGTLRIGHDFALLAAAANLARLAALA